MSSTTKYDRTCFKKLIDDYQDSAVLAWKDNVKQKIIDDGIVPDFVQRSEDYDSLFDSVCYIFAYIVVYSRKFTYTKYYDLLLRNFLNGLNIYVSKNENYFSLFYLFEAWRREFEQRGTVNVKTDYGQIDRLINRDYSEEFMFFDFKYGEYGWCIGKSSPTFMGTQAVSGMVKAYEPTQLVENLSFYPLVNPTYISIRPLVYQTVEVVGTQVMSISMPAEATGTCGIGSSEEYDRIKIDNLIDYEVSFRCALGIVDVGDNDNFFLRFAINGYDSNGDQIPLKDIAAADASVFYEDDLFGLDYSRQFWFRGVIYGKDSVFTEEKLNLGVGNNLQFQDTHVSIIPVIVAAADTRLRYYIWDIKVRPLQTSFSQGILGVKRLSYSIMHNRSALSDIDVKRKIEEELLSYNNKLIIKNI